MGQHHHHSDDQRLSQGSVSYHLLQSHLGHQLHRGLLLSHLVHLIVNLNGSSQPAQRYQEDQTLQHFPVTSKPTSLGSHLVLLVEQKILGRLGTEGQGGELQDGGDGGDGEQPGPALLRAQHVVHPQDLRDEDRQGDDQLVDGSQLETQN